MQTQKSSYQKWQQIKPQIEQKLKTFTKECTLEQYCEISQKVLTISPQELNKLIQAYEKGGNEKGVYEYLNYPNIRLQKKGNQRLNNEEKKKEQTQKEAGTKIVNIMKSAWNYYFRIVKGFILKPKDTPSSPFNCESISLARNNIDTMMVELKRAKYRWYNYTAQGIDDMQKQRQEIEDEKTFICLLNKIITTQIEKVISSRKSGEKVRDIPVKEEEEEVEEDKPREDIPERKKVSELINIGAYFQKRRKQLQIKDKASSDPMVQCQKRRMFNAAVLRYHLASGQ